MPTIPRRERLLLLLEKPPVGALYRIAIGYLTAPSYSHIAGAGEPRWGLIVWFLAILLSLRIGPLLMRKLLPFSAETLRIWSERRMIAKRFDSYQWKKLLWYGLGMSIYLPLDERAPRWGVAFAVFCVIAGGIGLLIWQHHARSAKPPRV
jgi:hypothetical protein